MNKLIEKLRSLAIEDINPGRVKDIVDSIDIASLGYKNMINLSENQDYTRVQLMAVPFDIELMVWPASGKSAIHKHSGFWGHVIVLQGKGNEKAYEWNGEQLIFCKESLLTPGASMHVYQDSVHSVENLSSNELFVTLHIYYPAQKGMTNTWIFDIPGKRIGILNEKAKSASWKESPECFDSIIENAFEYSDIKVLYTAN